MSRQSVHVSLYLDRPPRPTPSTRNLLRLVFRSGASTLSSEPQSSRPPRPTRTPARIPIDRACQYSLLSLVMLLLLRVVVYISIAIMLAVTAFVTVFVFVVADAAFAHWSLSWLLFDPLSLGYHCIAPSWLIDLRFTLLPLCVFWLV